ncbi:MAG TPA: hypothetical protein VMS31_16935 [Pyrinomonadaceae bacterium]|nr:hypothetical protein [Pyrinomonadaceae bacterium]
MATSTPNHGCLGEGLAEGERKYDGLERRLAVGPVTTVPPITLEAMPMAHRARTPVRTPKNSRASMPTGLSPAAPDTICRREAPAAFAQAISDTPTLIDPA